MILAKPLHLGPEFGAQFTDSSVVAAYQHRPPYPPEIINVLSRLVVGPQVVLDAGCGTGAIARGLAERVDRVDAIDPSPGMHRVGRTLPGGNHPALHWILGTAEEAPLHPPYGLIVTASSLHWMNWPVVLPRFWSVLAPRAVVVITEQHVLPTPWDEDLAPIIARYSTNRGYQPYDLAEEIETRGLFRPLGLRAVEPIPFVQSVEEYIESFHARNGFSRDRMTREAANAFDRAVETVVSRYCPDRIVHLEVIADAIWGEPAQG